MDSVSVTISTTEDGYTNTVTVQIPVSADETSAQTAGVAITRALLAVWLGSAANAAKVLVAAKSALESRE